MLVKLERRHVRCRNMGVHKCTIDELRGVMESLYDFVNKVAGEAVFLVWRENPQSKDFNAWLAWAAPWDMSDIWACEI